MRKALKFALIPAAFALAAGAGIAATAAPAQADVGFSFGIGVPLFYSTPHYDAPPAYYYAPNCHWDAYYGRVCY